MNDERYTIHSDPACGFCQGTGRVYSYSRNALAWCECTRATPATPTSASDARKAFQCGACMHSDKLSTVAPCSACVLGAGPNPGPILFDPAAPVPTPAPAPTHAPVRTPTLAHATPSLPRCAPKPRTPTKRATTFFWEATRRRTATPAGSRGRWR